MPAIKIADLEVGQSRVQLRAARDGKSQAIVLAHRVATQPGTRPLLSSRILVNELLAVLEGRAKIVHQDEGDKQHYLISFDPYKMTRVECPAPKLTIAIHRCTVCGYEGKTRETHTRQSGWHGTCGITERDGYGWEDGPRYELPNQPDCRCENA